MAAAIFLLPLLTVVAVTAASTGNLPDHLLLPSSNPSPGPTGRLTHIRFFWHDIALGPNATAVIVAQSATRNATTTNFGSIRVMDDKLTVGPDPSSQSVGKSQGLYVSADRETTGLMMVMTFAFTVGKYNGSTMAILGRNEIKTHVREMPILGGTGSLRFATGYVQAQTHSFDPEIRYNIIEYNCYFALPTHHASSVPEYVPFI